MAKYVQKRPDSSQWQFVLRVPSDLLHRYPAFVRNALESEFGDAAAVRVDDDFQTGQSGA